MVRDYEIIEMLKEGKSYSDIQMKLQVSPSRIAQVKKEYPNHFIGSSGNSSSDSSTTIPKDTTSKSPENGNLNVFNSSPQNSSSDPKVLLRMKELELEHHRTLKQMEYDEKERERDFEREKQELHLEELRIKTNQSSENKNLSEQLLLIKQELEELKEQQLWEEEEDDEEDEFDSSVFWDPYNELVKELIEKDEEKFDDDEINVVLEKINSLKLSFQELCDSDGTEVEDFDNWEILNQAETDMNALKREIKNSAFFTRAKLSMSNKWLKKLKENINDV